MPSHKKRTTNRPPRGLVPAARMKAAVDDVINGRTIYAVAKASMIDRMTLTRYVRKVRAGEFTDFAPNYVTKQIFSDEQEECFASYLLRASKLHYGLSTKVTRSLAYDYAIANETDIAAVWHVSKLATKFWLRAFMKRRPQLSLRSPEPISLARATAFNRHTVREFFDNLLQVRSRHSYTPQDIFNCLLSESWKTKL